MEELYQAFLDHYGLEDNCLSVESFILYVEDMSSVVEMELEAA